MFEEAHVMKETKFECSFIRWLNLHFWLGINSLKVPGDSQESVLIHQLHHISWESNPAVYWPGDCCMKVHRPLFSKTLSII